MSTATTTKNVKFNVTLTIFFQIIIMGRHKMWKNDLIARVIFELLSQNMPGCCQLTSNEMYKFGPATVHHKRNIKIMMLFHCLFLVLAICISQQNEF